MLPCTEWLYFLVPVAVCFAGMWLLGEVFIKEKENPQDILAASPDLQALNRWVNNHHLTASMVSRRKARFVTKSGATLTAKVVRMVDEPWGRWLLLRRNGGCCFWRQLAA
jgi:hypothetical protein